MTRFPEKLRLRWLLQKPTRFLALVSLSTLNLCKSIARFLLSQTLPFLTMDNLFADHSDYFSDDFDSAAYHLRPNRRSLHDDDRDFADERVYLLPYRSHSLSMLSTSFFLPFSYPFFFFGSRGRKGQAIGI